MQTAIEKESWLRKEEKHQGHSSIFNYKRHLLLKDRSASRKVFLSFNFDTRDAHALSQVESVEINYKYEKLKFFLHSIRESNRISLIEMYDRKRNESQQASEESSFLRYKLCKFAQENRTPAAKNLEIAINQETEQTFMELVQQWRSETRGISSTNELAMHPSYQKIIGMGETVVPLLLRELEKKTGRWFWALESITREDPIPHENRGNTQEMINAWLQWGKQKGYVW